MFFASDKGKNDKLLDAAFRGKTDEIRKLLKDGADVNAKDKYGQTALMNAVRGDGKLGNVLDLLHAGARINTSDKNGWTALLYAVKSDRIKIVRTLLEHGADVNEKDRWTALKGAEKEGHTELIELLKKYGTRK